jgi:hypothetical protein
MFGPGNSTPLAQQIEMRKLSFVVRPRCRRGNLTRSFAGQARQLLMKIIARKG